MTARGGACRIDELVQRAVRAYPDFSVDPQAFAARLESLPGELNAEDLYLAFAAAEGDGAALAIVEERHLARIDRFVAHLGRQASFVDEVRQQVRERILIGGSGNRPKILDYSGRGSLGAWIRVTATRQALDLLDREKRHRPSSDELEDDQLAATVDPELLAIRQRHLPQFRSAFRAALDSLDVRERNLLRLYLVDGLNIGRIGEIFGKSRATIGRMVVDCREKLLEETRRRLAEMTGASEGDVKSLIRLLQSQLDVSIGSFLRKG
jgi:RNA polymerase sigma-70 factor (ECF subfamily)